MQTSNARRIFFYCLAMIFVIIGAILRIAVFLQCRNLSMDEANVARNLFERGYAGLFKPLDHQQFAPPLFLWAEKTAAIAVGYSEYGLRLFALACSLLSLWLMYRLLRFFVNSYTVWYPLALMAGGYIYIRYATELKQYASDIVVCQLLLLLALNNEEAANKRRFLIQWAVVGSVAIWFSMPSVFILAGIFCYYLYRFTRLKDRKGLFTLSAAAAIWLLQFGIYYMVLLRSSIHDDYLQWWHGGYFFNLFSSRYDVWKDNWYLVRALLAEFGGGSALAVWFHIVLMVTGCIVLIRKKTDKAILLLTPLLCVFTAVVLHQFTMLPRVMLFSSPLLLLLAATGFDFFISKRNYIIKAAAIVCALVCLVCFGEVRFFTEDLVIDRFTDVLKGIKNENVSGQHLIVEQLANPYYQYYTQIHPGKKQWQSVSGGVLMKDGMSLDSLVKNSQGKSAIIYGYIYGEGYQKQKDTISMHRHILAEYEINTCKAIIFQ